jgi:hypothetical protein
VPAQGTLDLIESTLAQLPEEPMSPFVGQPCVRCGQTIASDLDGSVCAGCGRGVHHACRLADEQPDTLRHCSCCGGDPSSIPPLPGDDRLMPALPEADDLDRPLVIPDLRRHESARKKVLRAIVVIGLACVIIGLCVAGYRWMQHNEIERLVRQGFEQKVGQGVNAVQLKRTDEGNYAGTITTATGEEWHVTVRVTPMGSNKQIRWRARPPLARAESDLRKDMETKLNKKVRSLQLTRQEDGRFSGTAELESGEQFDVREGDENSPELLRYEWNQATVEKWIKQVAQERYNDTLRTLSVTRQGPTRYTGKATGTSGLQYDVSLLPMASRPGEATQVQLNLTVLPASLPGWVSRGLEKELKVKVKTITLKPHPDGHYHTGEAVCETGEVYELRAGTPPAWRNDARAGIPTWKAVLSPKGYPAWIRKGLEKTYRAKVKSLELKPLPNGNQEGIATLDDGRRFQVWLEKTKRDRKGEEEELWPDLGDEMLRWQSAPLP